ncbi:stalk domain-containing protein [Paenibacillus macquariensis]|uniref:SH3 domain-containing protein n=1 Tax=Paenibacillus macquariensis TaxID=948756 RepID=A0ABY1K4C4_9BACL|nr:stalk domain-containing protein [Paenibacillus macquariensis]MEC0088984.1 stalk domain-containing protein [Paenibacillus macquariensis]OAB31875.1 copper amine oxidase [Paenibacillus macquariensis subsp. macquariensis]SIR23976.1 SH3 domain-containing protein [Paenibacillus macquariensis]
MTIKKGAMLLLLLTAMLSSAPIHADTLPQTHVKAIYLDDHKLQLEVEPLLVNDTVLVPMRELFEAQGAKVSWNSDTHTVKATKGDMVLTYRIGERTAYKNGQPLILNVPGQMSDGYTMMPLRFVSEALDSIVKWDASTRTVRIFSSATNAFDTKILYGVNLRSQPDSSNDSIIREMLPVGEKVQVIQEVDAMWLEVRTRDNKTGYISAKPKYSDYTSASLADRQADELIAYGEKFLNRPYEFGAATDQTLTFDCSSFVSRLFKDKLSIDLPRVSYNQAKEGKQVGINDLRKGDLLFFSARGLDIGHVAIYVGNNRMLHTYSKELGVHYETLDDKWMKRFVTARRLF